MSDENVKLNRDYKTTTVHVLVQSLVEELTGAWQVQVVLVQVLTSTKQWVYYNNLLPLLYLSKSDETADFNITSIKQQLHTQMLSLVEL